MHPQQIKINIYFTLYQKLVQRIFHPKPCSSVSFNVNPIEISCSQTDETITHKEEIQLVESQEISEVESNLSVSDIDPFETMYGEMDEDSFLRIMEGNDWTYSPLFSDKEFLNDVWHKYTCTETCACHLEHKAWMRVSWDRYSEYQRN